MLPENEVHHKPRHLAERIEGLIPTIMLVAIVLLAIGLIYGIFTADSTPSWMR
ncbi:hypothetical protein [Phenylobacterium sp.]|jgi:cell division protein FtsL|uniref:hypothetical protein n=1 Tax=Phenylobacterium sp. TaxID=1871053 RepID=UPI002F939A18